MLGWIKHALVYLFFLTALAGGCPAGWISHRTSCYKFHMKYRMQMAATLACSLDQGSRLVEIDSQDENDFVRRLLHMYGLLGTSTWLGLNDILQEGRFVLPSNGQEPSFTQWGARQPDNFAGHEDCAVMLSSTGVWDDNSCTSVHPFVCERKWSSNTAAATHSPVTTTTSTTPTTTTTSTPPTTTTMMSTTTAVPCNSTWCSIQTAQWNNWIG